MLRALRVAVLLAAAALAAMAVRVVALRVAFPYQLEWMTGAVLDHVERVRQGLPLYTAPMLRWIPYIYTPLYYWLAALLPDSYLACRVLSLVCAAAQAACVWRLVRRGGGSPFWATAGVGLFVGCFFYVGYWYDVGRSDTLCAAMALVATLILVESSGVAWAVAAGALVGLAFFAKQQALAFAIAGVPALLARGDRRRAAAFGAASLGVVGAGTAWLDARSGGWFAYYAFKVPAAHGVDVRLAGALLDYDVPRGCVLLAASVAFVAWVIVRRRREHFVFAGMLAAGLAAALSSRLHVGGWVNVLGIWTGFACVALALGGAIAERALAGRRFAVAGVVALHLLLLAQLALWVRDPDKRVPDATLQADTGRFVAKVARLETRGEVLVVGLGHVTKVRHFQMSALADVVRVSGTPGDLLDALSGRRLAAIVDDARVPGGPELGIWPPVMLEDVPDVRAALLANYFVAERIAEREVRLVMPPPAFARWVYLPRAHPLRGLSDAELKRRQLAEMRLAAERSEVVESGGTARYAAEDIEELAGRELAAQP